ncbi:OVARIAN TUMOR DOMAIN-containing deubiquitinating enzyme 1-like [Typha latifolia]|uniref:OVARIAN TUMOR DOMAIN-containing deubiquitinating enzyme 1-like n=1 Tax=Typha latifolia TaxID=4733 RepID=UPI003C2E7444
MEGSSSKGEDDESEKTAKEETPLDPSSPPPFPFVRREGKEPLVVSSTSSSSDDEEIARRNPNLGGTSGAAPSSPILNLGGMRADARRERNAPVITDVIDLPPDDKIFQLMGVGGAKDEKTKSTKLPCIGDKEPFSALATDFPPDNSIIQEKIKLLEEKYASFRRTRRDGNCFFRSFIFSYMEQIIEMPDENIIYNIFELLEEFKLVHVGLGEMEDTYGDLLSDFRDMVITVLEAKQTSLSFCHQELLQKSRDDFTSDMSVMFLRLVASVEIKIRAENYQSFLSDMNQRSLYEFCEEEVIRMGVPCDQVQVIALSNALCVPVRLVHFDSRLSSSGAVSLIQHDFIPNLVLPSSGSSGTDDSNASILPVSNPLSCDNIEGTPDSLPDMPFVTLLCTDGHYDILYPK